MSDDHHDFTQDKRLAEHIQKQSGTLKTLSEGKDPTSDEFTQLLNYAKRVKQSEDNKPKAERDENLAQLLPHLEMIELANKNLQEASTRLQTKVKDAVSCAQKLDQSYTEYTQEISQASQSQFHEQPFLERHPAFDFNVAIPNVAAHHQTLVDQQSELDQNFSSKKAALINILLTESKNTPVNPSMPENQKAEVNKLRAELRSIRKDYDAALEKLKNASDEDKATYESVVNGHLKNYQEKANKLIETVTSTVIQPDINRKHDRTELEGLFAKAQAASNDEEKAKLIEQIKIKGTEYKEKYGQSALLDDSILRYKQAEQDRNLGRKGLEVSQAKMHLDSAHDNQMTAYHTKNKMANELTQTKEKAKPFLKKCVEALKKLVSFYLFRADFREKQYEKKIEAHLNAMDAAPDNTKKPKKP